MAIGQAIKLIVAFALAGTLLLPLSALAAAPRQYLGAMPSDSILRKLDGKSSKQRSTIKGLEISRAILPATYTRGDLRIEIDSILAIDQGVEVYARAWRKGTRLGFGKDGSVEFERFRFINPPVLITDATGPIIVEMTTSATGVTRRYRYREDAPEALRQALAQTIALTATTSERMVLGKRGNTTTTFYPEADPASAAGDARVFYNGSGESYATIQSASAGTGVENSGTSAEVNNLTIGNYRISRFFVAFDTSSISDTDTIDSATLSYNSNDKSSTDSDSVSVVAATPASPTTYVTGDFDQVGSTKLATDITIAAWSTSGYNDFALNASGLANVSKTGVSKFAFRLAKDISATQPTGVNYVDGRTADVVGTTQDPKLVVVHTAPVTPQNSLIIFFND